MNLVLILFIVLAYRGVLEWLECELIRWGGGGWGPSCIEIGYSEPKAERRPQP